MNNTGFYWQRKLWTKLLCFTKTFFSTTNGYSTKTDSEEELWTLSSRIKKHQLIDRDIFKQLRPETVRTGLVGGNSLNFLQPWIVSTAAAAGTIVLPHSHYDCCDPLFSSFVASYRTLPGKSKLRWYQRTWLLTWHRLLAALIHYLGVTMNKKTFDCNLDF